MADLFECSFDNISLHLKIYLKKMNWTEIQLPRFSWQLEKEK